MRGHDTTAVGHWRVTLIHRHTGALTTLRVGGPALRVGEAWDGAHGLWRVWDVQPVGA